MSDNILQKEFKTRDVNRMRNLITKNYDASTTTQIGYTKSHVEHVEGDIWEENGRKWTVKNGLRQTLTRFDSIKKYLVTPLLCPECRKPMVKGKVDKHMYSIHNKCLDCVILFETKLKAEGKFEAYERNIIKQGIDYHIKEMENLLLELAMDTNNESFVTEAGDTEEWKGKTDNTQIIQDIQEYIQHLKEM